MCGAVVASAFAANAQAADNDTVNVLYAGSLVNLMERSVGPAFEKETGLRFHGYAAGLEQDRQRDQGQAGGAATCSSSASPKVNTGLMGEERRAATWAWYVGFAESPLLIGYNAQEPASPRTSKTKRWDQVLQEPGIPASAAPIRSSIRRGAFTRWR